jgi:DNA polymerase-3 subunit alpha
MAAVETALERSRQSSRDRANGQATLFGLFEAAGANSGPRYDTYPSAEEWDQTELLSREKNALGCYVSGHPLNRYGAKLARLGAIETSQLSSAEPWSMAAVFGMVEGYQEKNFKSGGGRAAFFEIEDMAGRIRAKLRGDRVETYAPILTRGEPVLVRGKVSFPITDEPDDEVVPTLLVDEVVPLSDAVRGATRSVRLNIDAEVHGSHAFQRLRTLLEGHRGSCPIEIFVELPGGARVQMSIDGMRIEPSDALLSGFERLFGGCVAELR